MHLSIKRPLTGLLVAVALAISAVGAEAMGNANGPDAYIGIAGGSPQQYFYSANGNINQGYAANAGQYHQNGWSGWGQNNGSHSNGY